MAAISPLAPERFPDLAPIAGVRLAAYAAGIRYTGRNDMMLAELAPDTAVAGVLTRSLTAGAPVLWCRACLPQGKARAVVVNSGNANVFTGRAGYQTVETTAATVAGLLGCDPKEVFISSTGVIGEQLPAEKILAALPEIVPLLAPEGWEPAARAIMTTDTYPKGATATATIDGVAVRINGFAKGSGMIAPDMGTMLAYVFTDAALPPAVLQPLLAASADRSFNAITVDGDTSTSDTVLLCATQQAPHRAVASPADRRLADFRHALDGVMVDLAQQVVRDGEGAEKFVTIEVIGATTARAARRIGLAIGNSPLVKTALAAGDANWGRIVMAVGKAGEKVDRDRLSIAIGGTAIVTEGQPVPGYDEAPVAAHMQGREIRIRVDIGIGRGRATVWTCDLTHAYVDINGSYRS
ncbi:MAG: bifunctional glutamate N-acetyltransferase/amino-acid acetyltransferase ArgJ [Alphaproteobacteria bacterium]|nr:bifunctional glutamate N-acetyltransferase/amino-acid acetyltransferase ArgJ [Alphaproteobacteria bacterium]